MANTSTGSDVTGASAPSGEAQTGLTISQHLAGATAVTRSEADERTDAGDGGGDDAAATKMNGGDKDASAGTTAGGLGSATEAQEHGEEDSNASREMQEEDVPKDTEAGMAGPTSSRSQPREKQHHGKPAPTGAGTPADEHRATESKGEVGRNGKQQVERARGGKERNYYELFSQLLSADGSTDELEQRGRDLAADFFTSVYERMRKHGAKPQEGTELPETTQGQQEQLYVLLKTLIADRRSSMQRVETVIFELVTACFRSSWTLDQLLRDRVARAQVHVAPPTTAWGVTASTVAAKTVQDRLAADMETFRFDSSVYDAATIKRLRAVCAASHGFAVKPRKGTEDEWTIMWGIINGSILMRVLPQFLKRCCTLEQFQWLHHFMVVNAEGELYARLPVQSSVFDYNQTSKRLADPIRASNIGRKDADPRVDDLLRNVKVVSYNSEMHALHFHFYTKQDAIKWENMTVPFRNSQLELKNPDARYREVVIQADGTELITHKRPVDGAQDERYQAPYTFRLTNVTRTTEIDKVSTFLQKLTNNGLRFSVPIDPYGQGSDWSLTWEFFGIKSSCPPALENINRILWREHVFLIIHRSGAAHAPCHRCARIGHQEATCPTPESEWLTECTIVVTEPEIASIQTERSSWTTPEEAKAIFDKLGSPPAPVPDVPTGSAPIQLPPTAAQPPSVAPVPEPHVETPKPMHQQTPREQAASAWKMVMTRRPRKKEAVVGMKKPSGKRVSKQRPRHQANSQSKQSKKSNEVITIDSDEEMSDDEASVAGEGDTRKDQAGDATDSSNDDDMASSKSDLGTASRGRKDSVASNQKQEDSRLQQEALDNAVVQANMERLGSAIVEAVMRHQQPIEFRAIADFVKLKLPDRGSKASLAWMLEAIRGKIAETPGNGNCQFYAIIEAMLQRSIRGMTNDEIAIELTMLLKFGLQLASTTNGAQEELVSRIASLGET